MKVIGSLLLFVFGFLLLNSCSYQSEIIESILLKELSNPHEILSDDNHLVISDGVEGTTIYLYDIDDLSLFSKFGGTGDTTGKFIVSGGHEVGIDMRNDTLLISSHWKTSFFTKRGGLIKEYPIKNDTYGYSFLEDLYIGEDDTTVNDIMYYTFNLYDRKFGFVKEITRIAGSNQGDNGLQMLVRLNQGLTYENKFYFKGKSEEFEISKYDSNGEEEAVIRQLYERIPVSEQHKNDVIRGYEEHPFFSQFLDEIKKRMVFPEYLPAIYDFRIADDFIYALTHRSDEGNSVIYQLDLEGKLVQKLSVPLSWQGATEVYPYTISNGHLYQLVEKKEGEWELMVIRL
jgi:hypothetical protein